MRLDLKVVAATSLVHVNYVPIDKERTAAKTKYRTGSFLSQARQLGLELRDKAHGDLARLTYFEKTLVRIVTLYY